MLIRLFLALIILAGPAWSWAIDLPANKEQCLALCDQYYGGTTPPPVTPPPTTTKVFPWPITFERDSDQGNGAAAILFRTMQSGSVVAVTVNGEVARKGNDYKGSPVFLMSKSGDKYSRPLKFFIKTADGQVYTATSGSGGGGGGGSTVTGYTKVEQYQAYGQRNGGRWAWRIPRNGPSFGKQVKVVFANGHTVTVKNPSQNYRESDGFVWKSGQGADGPGDANTHTSHGGVYLHAPYKNPSQTVKIYFN